MNTVHRPTSGFSRRDFLKRSAGGAAALGGLAVARSAHAAGSDVIKIGLVGCGGRGSGAAVNAMNAGKDVRLVAMADIFTDHLQVARQRLRKTHPEQVAVADDHCFVGFDAYRQVIHSGVDVVLLAAASHFHPQHLTAAIDAGKHVFCEKPHGIDVPGLKLSMAAAEKARKKNLCLLSGLCWRYDRGVQEAMARVHDGAIGDIVAIQETYASTPYILREREPAWSEMEYQYQNWYHFNWLSGDQTAQQLIHSMDKASWALGDRPPERAWGMGGRQTCVAPKYGDQFDHHAVVYQYANGVRVFGFCRDATGCYNETSDVILGTKGRAFLPQKPRIEGEKPWRFRGDSPSMYDAEHQVLFDAIRAGKTVNSGDYMHTSSMLAILAQMVCYTGREITWDQAMRAEWSFAQPRYDFDAQPPVKPGPDGSYPAPIPGMTVLR